MHRRWRRVDEEREVEKERSLDPHIRMVLALVRVRLEFRKDPSSRRGTKLRYNRVTSRNLNAKMEKSGPKKGNDRNAQCSMKSCGKYGHLHEGCAWQVLISAMGAARVGIWSRTNHKGGIMTRQIISIILILLLQPNLPRGTRYML